jgi:hypothetical protein
LFTGSPVSLFWPFEIYHSTGHRGWLDVLNIVIFEGYRDAAIIAGSAIIFFLVRLARPHGMGNRLRPSAIEKASLNEPTHQ